MADRERLRRYPSHAQPANPTTNATVNATTVAELDCPGQLIVWSCRHWLESAHDWPALQQVFWEACGITNVEAALQGFQEMIGILSGSSRRTLFFHRPACRRVSADELCILNLVSALQNERNEHAEALVCWLVPASMQARLLRSAAGLAAALHKSGNVVSQATAFPALAGEPLTAMAPTGPD